MMSCVIVIIVMMKVKVDIVVEIMSECIKCFFLLDKISVLRKVMEKLFKKELIKVSCLVNLLMQGKGNFSMSIFLVEIFCYNGQFVVYIECFIIYF